MPLSGGSFIPGLTRWRFRDQSFPLNPVWAKQATNGVGGRKKQKGRWVVGWVGTIPKWGWGGIQRTGETLVSITGDDTLTLSDMEHMAKSNELIPIKRALLSVSD